VTTEITSLPEIVLNDVELECEIEGAWPYNITWYVHIHCN